MGIGQHKRRGPGLPKYNKRQGLQCVIIVKGGKMDYGLYWGGKMALYGDARNVTKV